MLPLICLVFNVTRTNSSVIQNSKNIFIMFLTFQKLKESLLKREVNACCDAWTTIAVFPQTLERFIYQTVKFRATCFQLTKPFVKKKKNTPKPTGWCATWADKVRTGSTTRFIPKLKLPLIYFSFCFPNEMDLSVLHKKIDMDVTQCFF